MLNSFVASLGTEAEMGHNAATISDSICRRNVSHCDKNTTSSKREGERHTSTGLLGHSDGKVMLVVGRNGLGQIDVLAHHAGKLNTHAFQLKVPCSEAVLAQIVVLNILKQTVVLLSGDLPLLPTRAERVVLGLHDGRAVENVVAVAFDGQPSVLLVVRGVPLADLEVVGSLPGREQRRAPIQFAAGLGSGIRLVQFG